jgi:2-(1,2-epoxy-1,2-dihydrophenyl)acetyl-CoA isomerase
VSVLDSATASGVRTLTLQRPDKLNAFNAAMHEALRSALVDAAQDTAVKVVVLTGAGRAFSSGQDLTEDLPRDDQGRVDLGPPLERDYNPLVLALHRFPKPTIAALNGPAVGAAMNIALACDIVLAARGAMLQEAFSRIGLVPDAGGTWLLPRIVGPKRALALMMTAEPIGAEDALRLGLVHRIYDDETFAAEAASFAASLAKGPALAFSLIKQAVAASLEQGLAAQLVLETDLQRKAGASSDFLEGVAAFREKRAPRFTGR